MVPRVRLLLIMLLRLMLIGRMLLCLLLRLVGLQRVVAAAGQVLILALPLRRASLVRVLWVAATVGGSGGSGGGGSLASRR